MSIHDGHRERMREDLLAQPETMQDHKLLEVLLFYANSRKDTNPVAHDLLDRFVTIDGVLDASDQELMKIPGVGERTVALFRLVKEMGRRYLMRRNKTTELIRGSKEIYELLLPYFYGICEERVILLCMDGKRKNLGVRRISEGNVNATEVTTRSVVEAALACNATQVILAHNHPSGLALPSDEDKSTTRYLLRVLGSVGVTLVDHVIFSDEDMVSMRESGMLVRET